MYLPSGCLSYLIAKLLEMKGKKWRASLACRNFVLLRVTHFADRAGGMSSRSANCVLVFHTFAAVRFLFHMTPTLLPCLFSSAVQVFWLVISSCSSWLTHFFSQRFSHGCLLAAVFWFRGTWASCAWLRSASLPKNVYMVTSLLVSEQRSRLLRLAEIKIVFPLLAGVDLKFALKVLVRSLNLTFLWI